MKVIPVGLAAHYLLDCTTICVCLKVTRADAVVVGFTSLDRPLTVSGVVYHPGFEVSALESNDTLAVDNMELKFLALDDLLPLEDLVTGRWDNAAYEIFQVNYESPTDGIDVLKRGNTGEVKTSRGIYVTEMRSLKQALQATQSIVTNKTCRARLGDAKCTVDLTPFTFTSTLTGVASARSLADSTRAEADDYFGEGLLTVTSGNAAGFTSKVKEFTAGVFTLSLPLPVLPAPGDAYTVIAGCRKRHDRTTDNPSGISDCKDKFDNVLNFQGEPHLKGIDAATKPGSAQDQAASTPNLPEEGA